MAALTQPKTSTPSTDGQAAQPAGMADRLNDGLKDPLALPKVQAKSVGGGGGTPGGGGPPGGGGAPSGGGAPAPAGSPSGPGGPGKFSLGRFGALQGKGGSFGAGAMDTAARGLSGHGGALPFAPVLQASFGGVDLSGVRAHTGAQAREANQALGSKAYAVGNDVAFGGTPDLHTAAHEAAHVVQQRKGVNLKDNTGQIGDAYERHADAVADRVVQGKSASDLLAPFAGGSGGSPAVQMAPGGGGPPLRRSQALAPEIDRAKFDYPTFKESTYSRWNSRGDELLVIDRWVKAVPLQDAEPDAIYAVQQIVDACEFWLAKVPVNGLEKKDYIIKRKAGVTAMKARAEEELKKVKQPLKAAATQNVKPPPAEDDKVEKTGNTDDVLEGSNELIGGAGGFGGTLGDYGDIHAVYQEGLSETDKANGSAMGKNNSEALSGINTDYLDATAMGTGGLGMVMGVKKAIEAEDGHDRAEGILGTLEGAGSTVHGAMKLTKGLRAGGLEDKVKAATALQEALGEDADPTALATAKANTGKAEEAAKANSDLGDIGGIVADGATAVAKLGSLVSQGIKLYDTSKEGGGLTQDEKVDAGLEMGKTGLEAVQAGLKVGVGGAKIAAKTAAESAGVVGGLATASGALGIVIGAIEIAQGGIQLYRAYTSKKALKEARDLFTRVDGDIAKKAQEAALKLNEAHKARRIRRVDIFKLKQEVQKLQKLVKELNELRKAVEPAMQSMEMIQNLKMESGGFKVAKGTLGVTSGALALSGVGAPVALAIGVIIGILSISELLVKNSRNRAANRLTLIAQRLTEEGRAKALPDESLDYRTLEKRVYKAYYRHIPEVMGGKSPTAIEDGEFTDIKHFTWEDKKPQVKGYTDLANVGEAGSLSDDKKKTTWARVVENGPKPKVKEEEEPGFFAKVNLAFSGDAHKSDMAKKAGAKEMADALMMLANNSFNPITKKYVPAPVSIQGALPADAPPDLIAQVKSATFDKLIAAARIPESRWAAWWTNAGGKVDNTDPKNPKIVPPDTAKLRGFIAGHIGG